MDTAHPTRAAPSRRPKYYDLNLAHLPPPGVVSMAHAWGSLPGDDDGAPEAGACTNRLVANDVDFEPLIGQARQSAIPVNLRSLTLREESSR